MNERHVFVIGFGRGRLSRHGGRRGGRAHGESHGSLWPGYQLLVVADVARGDELVRALAGAATDAENFPDAVGRCGGDVILHAVA